MNHRNTVRWEKEHYDLLYASKTCDECCAGFQKKFPKMKLSSIFSHWNHKNQYRSEYERLKNKDTTTKILMTPLPEDDDTIQQDRTKQLREAILELNLKNGAKIPWDKILKSMKDSFNTEGAIRAVVCGYGNYKGTNTPKYFEDIILTAANGHKIFKKPEQPLVSANQALCPHCKNILFKHQGQLKCNRCGYIRIDETIQNPGLHTITVKTKAITEPIKNARLSSVIDDDTIKLWKYRDLRAQQVQLMKEAVSTNKDILSAINKNTEAVTKMVQGIEEARSANVKRKLETLTHPAVI